MNRRIVFFRVILSGSLLILTLASGFVPARAQESLPDPNEGVGFDQNLNGLIPLDLHFTDETGREVRLGDYFGSVPVILVLAYYDCPMLCTQVLNDLTTALQGIPFKVGREFSVVTVSFSPIEGPDLAAAKKAVYLKSLGQPGAEAGWHFLTGKEPDISALTEAAGFRYRYIPAEKQYAHPSGVMILTPEGRFSRYILGIGYPANDIRLSLVEAADRKIGSLADGFYLLCYKYDPVTGRYNLLIHRVMQIGGALTVLGVGLLILALNKTGRRQPKIKVQV